MAYSGYPMPGILRVGNRIIFTATGFGINVLASERSLKPSVGMLNCPALCRTFFGIRSLVGSLQRADLKAVQGILRPELLQEAPSTTGWAVSSVGRASAF
jgi:hypothetical protein